MNDKPKKPQRLKARLPRGLADRGPAEIIGIFDHDGQRSHLRPAGSAGR